MKTLAIAYACQPDKGSEALVGWKFAEMISSFSDCLVITRKNNQKIIEEALSKNPYIKLRFEYVDLPEKLSFWKRKKRGIILYYFLWQLLVYFKAKKILKKEKFDVIHQITFTNFYAPCFAAKLTKNFVIGPLAGVYDLRFSFFIGLPLKEKTKYIFQKIMRFFIVAYPFSKIKRARIVFAANEETYNFLRKINKNAILLPAIGVSQNDIFSKNVLLQKKRSIDSLSVLCSGDLTKNKGFDIALISFSRFQQKYPEAKIDIYGEGPEESRLKKLANNLRIKNIKFFKPLPRDKYLNELKNYDIILHPAYRESGAFVILEAIANNVIPIALNLQGPGLVITENVGFKVDADNIENAIKKIANNLEAAASNVAFVKKESLSNIFFWEYKQLILKRYYENLICS